MSMVYRLPEISDKNILLEYVQEHYDNNEFGISASMGLSSSEYDKWVEKFVKMHLSEIWSGENRCCSFAL